MTQDAGFGNPKENARELDWVTRQSLARLYPSITNPHWLVLTRRREIFKRWIARLPGNQLKVLDIGGRIQPYRPLLKDRIKSYVAVDISVTALVDVLARAEELPFQDDQFDLVLCTQMLQYVADPARVLSEIFRVLKSSGCLLLSVPSVYPMDSSEECWRFLPGGLRHLLSGFTEVQIEAEGNSISGFFRTINACLVLFAKYDWLRNILRHTACPVLNCAGVLGEAISASSNEQLSANYSVLATK
jgi:SAM-dependent methyltransferase